MRINLLNPEQKRRQRAVLVAAIIKQNGHSRWTMVHEVTRLGRLRLIGTFTASGFEEFIVVR